VLRDGTGQLRRIPAKQSSEAGTDCQAETHRYFELNPGMNNGHPLALSFLFATGPVPKLACNVSPTATDLELAFADQTIFDKRICGKPWTDVECC
jgi:hypothetical protein